MRRMNLLVTSLVVLFAFCGCSSMENSSIPAEKRPPQPIKAEQIRCASEAMADMVEMNLRKKYEYRQDTRFVADVKKISVNKNLESMEKFGVKTYFWAVPVEGEIKVIFPDGSLAKKSVRCLLRFFKDPTDRGQYDFVELEVRDI